MGVDELEPKVLALSSGGGHWIQLLRLRPAFDGPSTVYASTRPSNCHDVHGRRFRTVPDANRDQRLRSIWCALRIAALVVAERPNAIVSTGALPGYLALRIGKLVGARTIWIDSVANADELSMAGQKIGKHADLWLTQWEHLADTKGPHYFGSVFG